MSEIFCLLDELNIDKEFKTVLTRISKLVSTHLSQSKWALDEDQKLRHLVCADLFVNLIADCYQANEDYQNLIKFMKDDINSHRHLIKKNSSEIANIPEENPTFH